MTLLLTPQPRLFRGSLAHVTILLAAELVLTDADGSFEIGPLYSGEYTLPFSDRELHRYATRVVGRRTHLRGLHAYPGGTR